MKRLAGLALVAAACAQAPSPAAPPPPAPAPPLAEAAPVAKLHRFTDRYTFESKERTVHDERQLVIHTEQGLVSRVEVTLVAYELRMGVGAAVKTPKEDAELLRQRFVVERRDGNTWVADPAGNLAGPPAIDMALRRGPHLGRKLAGPFDARPARVAEAMSGQEVGEAVVDLLELDEGHAAVERHVSRAFATLLQVDDAHTVYDVAVTAVLGGKASSRVELQCAGKVVVRNADALVEQADLRLNGRYIADPSEIPLKATIKFRRAFE